MSGRLGPFRVRPVPLRGGALAALDTVRGCPCARCSHSGSFPHDGVGNKQGGHRCRLLSGSQAVVSVGPSNAPPSVLLWATPSPPALLPLWSAVFTALFFSLELAFDIF